jgi:hypothetical protein
MLIVVMLSVVAPFQHSGLVQTGAATIGQRSAWWLHDTHHNDIQHNDTQHNKILHNDIEHSIKLNTAFNITILSIMSVCFMLNVKDKASYAECHYGECCGAATLTFGQLS